MTVQNMNTGTNIPQLSQHLNDYLQIVNNLLTLAESKWGTV